MKQLLKIADSYTILLSSQHSYLMSLYDALVSSIEKKESKVFIDELFDQMLEQVEVYYETTEILAQITLHDDYLELMDSKKEILEGLSNLKDEIYKKNKTYLREKIYLVQKELCEHLNKMQKTLDVISDKHLKEKLILPEEDKLGITVIDYQHNKIMELIEKLIKMTEDKYDREQVNDSFTKLIHKTKQHFAFEEFYFKQYHYPNYEEHKHEHNVFIKNMIINKNKIYSGLFAINAHDYFIQIKKDTISHIEVHDTKYTSYIIDRIK